MSAKSCIRTEEAAERICTYRDEYIGRGFQMKKHVIAAVAAVTLVTTAMSGCTGADTTAGGESVNGIADGGGRGFDRVVRRCSGG